MLLRDHRGDDVGTKEAVIEDLSKRCCCNVGTQELLIEGRLKLIDFFKRRIGGDCRCIIDGATG